MIRTSGILRSKQVQRHFCTVLTAFRKALLAHLTYQCLLVNYGTSTHSSLSNGCPHGKQQLSNFAIHLQESNIMLLKHWRISEQNNYNKILCSTAVKFWKRCQRFNDPTASFHQASGTKQQTNLTVTALLFCDAFVPDVSILSDCWNVGIVFRALQ